MNISGRTKYYSFLIPMQNVLNVALNYNPEVDCVLLYDLNPYLNDFNSLRHKHSLCHILISPYLSCTVHI